MDYAIELLIAVLLGLYAGHWLDTKTGKGPLFTLLGVIIGMTLGIGVIYKRTTLIQERKQDASKKKDDEQ